MRVSCRLSGILVVALALGWLAGCGDDPQTQMQQAQIALSNNKPDLALEYASSVLDAQPNLFQAMLVKARAEIMLNQLHEADETLESMVKIQPGNIDVRRLRITWAFRELQRLLGRSKFASDERLQEKFDQVLKQGNEETDWLAGRNTDEAEVAFLRARFADTDATRFRVMLRTENRSIDRIDTTIGEEEEKGPDATQRRYERNIEIQLNSAEQFLREAIGADPRHFAACRMYIGLLIQRQRWLDLWDLARDLAEQKDLPNSLAESMVKGIQSIPTTVQAKAARLDVGWRVLSAVDVTQQNSRLWQLSAARLHMDAQEWDEAKELLDEVIKKAPADVEARYFLALTLYYQKEFAQAREVLEKLRKRTPNRYMASRIETLYGRTLAELDESLLAKEALRTAMELNPNNDDARLAFMGLMAQEGQYGESAELESYYQNNPSDPRAIRFMLQHRASQGDRDGVAQLIDQIENLSPLTDEHIAILVDGYSYLQKYDRAERYARQLLRRQPDALRSHLMLAATMLRNGQDKQVKEMLEELKQKFPDDVTSVDQMLGELYLRHSMFDRSIDLIHAVVEKQPDDIRSRLLLAQAYTGLAMLEEAIEQINEVFEREPDHVDAHALAARIYQAQGKPDKAEQHLDLIDESRINERTNPMVLAQLRIKREDFNGAIQICNRAIAIGNTDPELRLLLTRIYLQQDEPAQAETTLQSLIEVHPDHLRAFLMLSQLYLRQGDLDRGLNELAKLQRVNEPFARLAQAALLMAHRNPDEAMTRLEPIYTPLIRKRDPNALRIADAMAKIHLFKKDLDGALAVYEPMVEEDLKAHEVELRRIGLTSSKQPVDATIERLDALAQQLNPEERALRFQVLRWYIRLAQYDRALVVLDEWLEELPDHPTLLRWKGDVMIQRGQPAEAISVYQLGTDKAPESLPMWLSLAHAHELNLDYPAAETVLRQAAQIDNSARIASLASLGKMFVNLGLNRQATLTFEELERSSRPRDPRVLLAMGQAYMALGQDNLARQRLSEIPRYAPQYAAAQVMSARIEQRQGMADQARSRLEDLARSRKYASAAVQELVALKLRNRSVEDMVRWSDKALSLSSLSDGDRLKWLAVRLAVNANDRQWAIAAETLDTMTRLAPDNLPLVAARVAVLIRLNQIEQARSIYRQHAKALAESHVGTLYALILNESKPEEPQYLGVPGFLEAIVDGDLDAARSAAENLSPRKTIYRQDLLTMLDRADADSPEVAQVCASLGLAVAALDFFGLPQLAEDFCKDVTARRPAVALAHALLVRALLDQGKPVTEALTAARRALPRSMLVTYLNAREKRVDEDYEAAIKLYRRLLDSEPENYHVKYVLAQTLQTAGQTDQAIAELQEIVADDQSPYRVLALNDVAYIIADNHPGRLDEAYTFATQALESAPNLAALLDTIGWIEHLRNRHEEAKGYLNRAVRGLNDVPSVHYHLGMVYQSLENLDWARYHLQSAADSPADQPDVEKAKQALSKIRS